MFVTSPGQTIEIKKIRHRLQVALSFFFPYDTADSQQIRIPQHRCYYATLQGRYLPYRKMQVDVLPTGDAAPGRSFSSLENQSSETIPDATTQDDHTGISSVAEEPSAHALTAGKTEAADMQEDKDEPVRIAFTNRPFSVRMMLSSTLKSLPAHYLLRQATKKAGLIRKLSPHWETGLSKTAMKIQKI